MINNGHDYSNKKVYSIYAGTTSYLKIHVKNKTSGENLDLSHVVNIEWVLGRYSVKDNSSILSKDISSEDIQILKDDKDKLTNTILIKINTEDTIDLQGGFIQQITALDSDGERFMLYDGILVINKKI